MPVHRIEIAAEAQGPARAQYDAGVPLDVIARALGMSRATLRRCIEDLGWAPRRRLAHLAPAPAKRPPPPDRSSAPDAAPPAMIIGPTAALVERVLATVDRELAAVDRILDTLGPPEPDAVERGARTLANLARTLRDIMQMRQPGASPRGDDDEPEIRDLDEFRRDLSRRLDRLVAGAKAIPADAAEQ
jgi:hypothetical protein